MSSHHIVRAKQEPALIILNIQHFDEEYLGQLLEWSPTILVAQSAYEEIESMGIKIDIVIGDVASKQSNLKVLDAGDVELFTAINYLMDEDYPAANIIADKVLDLPASVYESINLVWFCANEKIYRIKTGFKFWKPKGTKLRFQDLSEIEVTNLSKHTNGTFSVIDDGFVTFNFAAGGLLIAEQL